MKPLPLLLALLLSACAAAPTPKPAAPAAASPANFGGYTAAEYKNMALCTEKSKIAFAVAAGKQQGVPETEAKRTLGPATVIDEVPLVEQVYAASFDDPLQYSVTYFEGCSHDSANVSGDRIEKPRRCMAMTMVAVMARVLRAAGLSKQDTYRHLGATPGDVMSSVVDQIYAPATIPEDGSEIELWESCMNAG